MEFPQVALNRNLRNSFSNGGTGLNLLLYGRLFGSGYDCAGLSRNPWQLFAPLPRRIWAPAAAGATTHATTGALAGSGAATAGTAARTRAHPTSGVLAGAGAVTAGDAARVGGATTHDTSGALAGAGAAVAGTAAHIAIHATSGALAGAGGAIAGTAARVAAAVTHDTSGALSGGGAIIVGIARGPQPDAVVSGGGGWAYAPMPRRKTKKELRDERIALGILPPDVIAELPAPVVKKARKVGTIKVEDLFGKAEVTAMSTIDLEIAVQRIKRRKRQRQEEELLLM